jgi:hypothetical protein
MNSLQKFQTAPPPPNSFSDVSFSPSIIFFYTGVGIDETYYEFLKIKLMNNSKSLVAVYEFKVELNKFHQTFLPFSFLHNLRMFLIS